MTTRTLGPRDLDPRTLRVVRRMLDELSEELQREADNWCLTYRRPNVRGHDEYADYASGLHSAVHDVDVRARIIKNAELAMRARLRRRQR